jgi:hypothetical protein
MKQRPRIYYTETQKALMWERWKKGESLHQIAALFDRNHSSIQRILAEPAAFALRKGSGQGWPCRWQSGKISRSLAAGHSIRRIANFSDEHRLQLAARSAGMAVRRAIEQTVPTMLPGRAPNVPRHVS